jgi:hypothetical protein
VLGWNGRWVRGGLPNGDTVFVLADTKHTADEFTIA